MTGSKDLGGLEVRDGRGGAVMRTLPTDPIRASIEEMRHHEACDNQDSGDQHHDAGEVSDSSLKGSIGDRGSYQGQSYKNPSPQRKLYKIICQEIDHWDSNFNETSFCILITLMSIDLKYIASFFVAYDEAGLILLTAAWLSGAFKPGWDSGFLYDTLSTCHQVFGTGCRVVLAIVGAVLTLVPIKPGLPPIIAELGPANIIGIFVAVWSIIDDMGCYLRLRQRGLS